MTLLRPAASFVLACALGAAVFTTAAVARADDELARQHFRQGVGLYDKKQYPAALESFRAAYAEKPSPGIKQNIALSLKGLGRNVEAATAFDEALDEGADTLKPAVRAAMLAELAALSKLVATVNLKVVASADKKPVEDVVVSVDGAALTPAALRRPVRLEPGIHVFTAHAPGFAEPPQKRLSLLAGSPVDATFELGAPSGMLTVRPSVPGATVQVDGAEVARGEWSGRLPAGTHTVTVAAPGYQTTTADLVVSAGTTVEYPITLVRTGEAPPRYEAARAKPPKPPKNRYIVPTLAYQGQSLRLAPVLGERIGGSKRQLTGISFGVRGGYRLTRVFALELHGVLGQVKDTYRIHPQAPESSTQVVFWQLIPALRLTTIGAIRFTSGMGIGLQGLSVTSDIGTGNLGLLSPTRVLKGSGIAASWLVDLGVQFDIGSLFLETVAFLDVHGVGTTREDGSNARMFLSSPSTRAGIRLGLGIPF